jgi:four helix bundle protein
MNDELVLGMEKKNVIQEKSFDFAVKVIGLYKELVAEKEYVISKQLLRSGTSIGANVEEAIAGYSKKDFASKMSIALKEARETSYWLRLLEKSELTNKKVNNQMKDADEIVKILSAIVKTAQQREFN